MRQEKRAEWNGNSVLVLSYMQHNWYLSLHKGQVAVKDTVYISILLYYTSCVESVTVCALTVSVYVCVRESI